ncbi:MAG: hypothetical protein K8S94_05380 [Planctomycetia bacterium]|nr:hypothetical protein [Planctomycetia bacterium]
MAFFVAVRRGTTRSHGETGMAGEVASIAVCNDFLRDDPNGLGNHPANRAWLAAIVRHLSGPRFQVQEMGSGDSRCRHIDVAECMRALDMPLGPEGWAAAWDSQPNAVFLDVLARHVGDADLVVGFGLPNIVVRAIDAMSIRFLDFEVSPLRFATNLELDARTNIPALAHCSAWQRPLGGFDTAAVDLIGRVARWCPDLVPAAAGNVGVIFGQIDIDAALIHEGTIVDFSDFVPEITTWAEGLDHVLYRPHPYAADHRAFDQLRRILPRVRPTLMNSYQLLASQRLSRILALSSGIIDEASFFQVPATRLFMPRRRKAGFHWSSVANLNLVRGEVLERLLADDPLPEIEPAQFDLRRQFQLAWGLSDDLVPSDFLVPPQFSEPQPAEQPLAEQPLAEQPLAEQPLAEQPLAEQPLVEQPLVEQPLVEQPAAEPPPAEPSYPKKQHALRRLASRLAGFRAVDREASLAAPARLPPQLEKAA